MTISLDYNEKTQAFILRVPRSLGREKVQAYIREHGFNFSTTASTDATAVLFTKEPYAAAAFPEYATPRAREQIGGILAEVKASWAPTSTSRYWSPPDRELWEFQRADLDYALRRTNTLIGDQPGLGKTPVAVSFANEIKARHVLAVVPANIRGQWAKRVREWWRMSWDLGPDAYVRAVTTSRGGIAPTSVAPATWNIVSYDLARHPAIARALARDRYDLIIFDEAHYLKTHDAKRTRALLGDYGKTKEDRDYEPIFSRADRGLALTGTPLPNRPREAYTITRAFCWDAIDWLSEDAFKERFNPSMVIEGTRKDGSTYRYVDERSGRHSELQNRLRACFMVRHLKREVLAQLKLPIYDLVQVEETGAIKQALFAESLLGIDPDSLEGASAEVLGHIATARRLMGEAMAPQVADYIDMQIDGGEEKIVLFAHHHNVLNILQHRLAKHGLVRIDGHTSVSQKDKRVRAFIEDRSIKVILGQMQAMGTGTDGLQEVASYCGIAEPDWTPGNNIQAVDRLDRFGQRHTVKADIFVAPGSIAERVLASALRKLNVTDAALDRRGL